MVNKEEEKMSPRDILKVHKIHEKKTKKSRKGQFLRLFYSNPQKLLKLIKNLYDDNSVSQQMKVNLYLQNETGTELCFLIELCKLYKEGLVRVIGTKVLNSEVRFQEDNELMKRLRNLEEPLSLGVIDKNLEKEITSILDDFSVSKLVRCQFFPIYHPYKKNIIFYACLVNNGTDSCQNREARGIIGECFRYCQEIIINTMRFDEQKQYHNKQKDILQTGITNLELVDNFTALLLSMKQSIIEILNSERCNLYVLDGNNAVSRICDHGVSYDTYKQRIRNVVIPFGVGLVGTVALTGVPINCIEANTHPLYRQDLDIPAGLNTRNVLCFPLMLYGRVYGVVEAVNKTCGYSFSGSDISLSEYLGNIFGIQLYMSLTKKKNWDDISRRVLIDTLMLENRMEIDENDIKLILTCSDNHTYAFLDYMFIPSSIPIEHNMCVCLLIFEDLDLLQKTEIDRSAFVRFLVNVKIRQQQFLFHGWQHAFNTLLFVYTTVKKENILENGTISAMQCFCLFIAALCHDMEYGGPVTPFMPTSGTTLGSLYSSPGSVVQFHSVAQTVRLLADCGITDDFNLEKFKEFISLLDTMILDMDLGNHVSNRSEVKNLIEQKKIFRPTKNRRHFFAILLTCSDISDFCKPWEYMEPQVERISDEFYGDEIAYCQGLIDFTELVENVKLKKVMLQLHFIKNICEPAFSLLSTILPRTDGCNEAIEYNGRSLMAKKDKIIQSQLEQF